MERNCGEFFFSWPEAFQAGVESAGGKGWNLGRLERYDFTIPAGGVLSAGAYRSFIEENSLREATEEITKSVTVGNIGEREIEEKLFQIREKIKVGCISPHIKKELISKLKNTGILEKPLAVRSSATAEDSGKASFAGVHESFLNVRGMDNILTAIKGCYASLWTLRAVAYRRKMNIGDNEVIAAVVIMEMVDAVAAGVSFTCEPRTGREDVVLISANFGLGESVVSGAVDPDEYRLDYWNEITEKKIGRKEGKTIAGITGGTEFVQSAESPASQVLTDENIRKLGLLVLRVFEALGCGEQHQDIEWVFNGKDFALVQARPVTALPRYTFAGIKNQPAFWSNANFRDASPMVQSTINWSLGKLSLNILLSAPFKAIGYQMPPGLRLVRLYQGRSYLNASIQQWLFYDALGAAPREINEIMGGHQPEIEINEKKPFAGIKGCKRLGRLLKFIFIYQKTRRNAQKSFDKMEGIARELLKENFNSIPDKDVINKSVEIRKANMEFSPVFMFCATSLTAPLEKALEKFFPGKGKAMANALMAGRGDITSAQQGYRLVEMAEIARGDAAARSFFSSESFNPLLWEKELPEKSPFKQSLRNFLTEYGHRGVYECDLINPRWREEPSYLLNVVRSTMETADLGKIKARQKEKADEARREVYRRIPFHKRVLVNYLLKQALKGAELREMAKSVFLRMFEPSRLMLQGIGHRFVKRGILIEPVDIYHCAWNEIVSILHGDWDGRGLDVLVAERKAGRKEMEALSPPDLIIDETPRFAEPVTRSSSNVLSGMGVAAGSASGPDRLVYHPDQGAKLQAGDVLVAPSTDPGWTPLFLRASAIVVETGGSSSHGSIVAREYGIPAVVNIPGVMRMLHDGQRITVDGDGGKIYL